MSKLAEHLRKHLRGEVLESPSVLEYFSTDSSIFTVPPRTVVYPANTTDVRKLARFCWQLAERGKKLAITARGKGTDQAGGALGDGVMMAMTAHMNKLIDLDRDSVTVQPGMLYGDLQRTLHSHGRYLPPYPSSIEFSTLGGAVANNAHGEKSLKYGNTADFIKELEVVLSNGQVIRTRPLSKRELSKKKGQTDFEGDLYRAVDGLLLDNADLIESARPSVSKNSAGYALWDVRRSDGTFDLSRLIAGSQGTLGLVTEITLRTENYNPDTHLVTVFFDDLTKAAESIGPITKLKPSAIEMVDHHLLEFVGKHHPHEMTSLREVLGTEEMPRMMLLVEFDDSKTSVRKRKTRKIRKILRDVASGVKVTTDPEEQEEEWKIRRSVSAVMWEGRGNKKALPIVDDGVVPADKFPEFLHNAYALFDKYNLEIAIWGHAGDANFHMQPFLNLDSTGDRQTVFKLMDEFYGMVLALGGSTCGEHNDGRLRGPYLKDLYGEEMYGLLKQIKQAFDPHGILNPGVKIDVDKKMNKKQVRRHYNTRHLYDHLPNSQ